MSKYYLSLQLSILAHMSTWKGVIAIIKQQTVTYAAVSCSVVDTHNSKELMSSEGVRQGGAAHTHQTGSIEASSWDLPQSAESWLSSPSSSRWYEVWVLPLPGIQTMLLLPKSLSDRQGIWWSWAYLRDKDNEKKMRKGREGEERRENHQYQLKSPDRETAPGKVEGFYISTSAVGLTITICSFKSSFMPIDTPIQKQWHKNSGAPSFPW